MNNSVAIDDRTIHRDLALSDRTNNGVTSFDGSSAVGFDKCITFHNLYVP
jgi:hypothetical protein